MRAFEFDTSILNEYASFSRSFTTIRAEDLAREIDRHYEDGHFWPAPLLSLNPAYERGPSVAQLASDGVLTPETAAVFRSNGAPLRLHRHQGEAVAKALAGQSFVVTTGTGSGKSLCFFIPIVDQILKARSAGEPPRTRAIIVYPMNALANSQLGEVEKYVGQSDLPESMRPTVARYTGQESDAERKSVAANPPDILLTNYMMLELLLTRQDATDARVIENCRGLEFIVLDELHTYRGRQGADVSILVRRLKDRCRNGSDPICIGTSATMASEDVAAQPREAVARVASRIFGTKISADSVITESLRRATRDDLGIDWARKQLAETLSQEIPDHLPDSDLREHPLAVWAELVLGLDEAKARARRTPTPLDGAISQLAADSGVAKDLAASRLADFLARTALPEKDRGGSGEDAFMAFKLHRFISGAGDVLTTLKARPRNVLLEGQRRDPSDPEARLYPTRFCRACGQEYHVVSLRDEARGSVALPRDIDDTPSSSRIEEDEPGYLTPYEPDGDEFRFYGDIESFPEEWREERRGVFVLRQNRKKQEPRLVSVRSDGLLAEDGAPFWFLPGRFGFCLACHDQPSPQARERNKLGGLSAEGRSSATTTIVTAMLRAMNQPEFGLLDKDKRKTLGFGDNRQDSALQAGHFNDSVFVTLLRGAILRAVLDAGTEGLADDGFGTKVQKALGYLPHNENLRVFWMAQPDTKGANVNIAAGTLAKVLEHRVWADMRRGWRFT
ncbi:DEAD/DEAH box helicase [Ruegeria aquimaris]|uniref:DEAD/DEAH box helicase n=1 Tax=Ruegeria aquimaris TaxID=2984333 RepID=A0ABT3AT02_9RHOB|nr:DEAD/DEAH box helicase [Ruegeria sp. XHP0148]MCV2891427.1 DEAD/DEAH box helicase [Ruegeria sp. XHP0148]